MMLASVRHDYCPVESVKVEQIPIPEAKEGEIRVRVMATTVNRTDIGVLTGKPYLMRAFAGFPKPRYSVTGTDFAGVIDQVGKEVSGFKEGDRVWGFWDHGIGTHANYACIPTKYPIQRIPDSMSFAEAVGCGEAAHYAYNFLEKVQLNESHHVLVNGGTGAIGSAAIQLLKARGIQVTAVCHGSHLGLVQKLGANRVIALEETNFTKENHKYDFVFDAVGKSRFSLCKPILKPKGIYISSELGPNWENPWLALASPFFKDQKVVFPVPGLISESLPYLQSLWLEGKFNPLMDRSFPLTQAREAFQYVASGKKIGNVILSTSGE